MAGCCLLQWRTETTLLQHARRLERSAEEKVNAISSLHISVRYLISGFKVSLSENSESLDFNVSQGYWKCQVLPEKKNRLSRLWVRKTKPFSEVRIQFVRNRAF